MFLRSHLHNIFLHISTPKINQLASLQDFRTPVACTMTYGSQPIWPARASSGSPYSPVSAAKHKSWALAPMPCFEAATEPYSVRIVEEHFTDWYLLGCFRHCNCWDIFFVEIDMFSDFHYCSKWVCLDLSIVSTWWDDIVIDGCSWNRVFTTSTVRPVWCMLPWVNRDAI